MVSASEDGGSDLDSPVPEFHAVLEQVLDEFEDELGDRPEAPYQNAHGDTVNGKHGYETASQFAKLRHAALLRRREEQERHALVAFDKARREAKAESEGRLVKPEKPGKDASEEAKEAYITDMQAYAAALKAARYK